MPQPLFPHANRFQSTLPRRERRTAVPPADDSSIISIHAPTKGATPETLLAFSVSRISIHAPTKGATIFGISFPSFSQVFQSTLPRRERPCKGRGTSAGSTFQSTLPRRERLSKSRLIWDLMNISIHAPTKGATNLRNIIIRFPKISIHAPTKGATEKTSPRGSGTIHFNPRSHEGSDFGQYRLSPVLDDFNPRSHEGSDP